MEIFSVLSLLYFKLLAVGYFLNFLYMGNRQGESCDSVCKSNGQSCVPSKLSVLNQCEM